MAVFKGFTLLKVRHYCSQKDYTWNKLSFKGALFTNSPMNGIPLPPLFPRGRQGAGGAVGRTTNAQQPARGTMLSPPPAPPPRSKAAQPNGSTCTPHPELNGRHDARGAGGEGGKRKQEGGSGTRGRAGPSAPYVPRRPQAPT